MADLQRKICNLVNQLLINLFLKIYDDTQVYKFSTLFKSIKCFNSPNLEKRIYVKQFMKDYPSTLSNQNVRRMKTLFLEAIEILEDNQLIESRFKVFCNGKLKSVEKLTTQNISEGFLIYEKINFFQLPGLDESTGLE